MDILKSQIYWRLCSSHTKCTGILREIPLKFWFITNFEIIKKCMGIANKFWVPSRWKIRQLVHLWQWIVVKSKKFTLFLVSLFDRNSIPKNIHHFLALSTGVWQYTPFKLQTCQTGEHITYKKKTKMKYMYPLIYSLSLI